jgi:protein gp37
VTQTHHIRSYCAGMTSTDGLPACYEIRIAGRLDARWDSWFDGLSLARESDGTTVLRGVPADQAALHGTLQKLRDLGLPLISVLQTSTAKD